MKNLEMKPKPVNSYEEINRKILQLNEKDFLYKIVRVNDEKDINGCLSSLKFSQAAYLNDPKEFFNIDKSPRAFQKIENYRFSKKIASLSKNAYKNNLMWSYYCNHKGLCLIFDRVKVESIARNNNIEIRDVIYSSGKDFLQYRKSPDWKHEKEVRLCKNSICKQVEYIESFKEAIKGVIIGAGIKKSLRNYIEENFKFLNILYEKPFTYGCKDILYTDNTTDANKSHIEYLRRIWNHSSLEILKHIKKTLQESPSLTEIKDEISNVSFHYFSYRNSKEENPYYGSVNVGIVDDKCCFFFDEEQENTLIESDDDFIYEIAAVLDSNMLKYSSSYAGEL